MDCTFELEADPAEDVRIDGFDALLIATANFAAGVPCRRRYLVQIDAHLHLYSDGMDYIFFGAYSSPGVPGFMAEVDDCGFVDLEMSGGIWSAATPSGVIWPCNAQGAPSGRAVLSHSSGVACA